MDPIRFGYVGCGFVAQTIHLPHFASLPGVQFEALAETRPRLREAIAAKYGIPRRYESHRQLCEDPHIDAVGVSAPYEVQPEIARDLLAAGKAVFMEKPMAVSVAQAKRLLAAEKAGGGRLMVAYMKRYDAGNELVKRTVDALRQSGELGPVTYLRAHGFCGAEWTAGNAATVLNTDEAPPPAPKESHLPHWLPPENKTGYLNYLQQYTHNLNLLRWLMDAREVGVRAVDFDPQNGYHGVAVLEIGGVRAVLESGYVSHWGWDEHTQVYFRDGWVRTEAPPLLLKNVPASVEVYRGGKRQSIERLMPGASAERWSWSYKREAEAFIECVRTGAPFRSGAADTLYDVRAFEDIYRAWLGLKTESP